MAIGNSTMMGNAHFDSKTSKASCHCGRKICSGYRKVARRSQRRIEAQAVRREIQTEVNR